MIRPYFHQVLKRSERLRQLERHLFVAYAEDDRMGQFIGSC